MDKLYQGDCRTLLKQMPIWCVDGIFTDPPYNIDLQPQRKTHGTIANDALPQDAFEEFLTEVFGELYRVLKPDRVAWVCCNWQCIGRFYCLLESAGFTVKNCVVWVKNNFGIGNHLRPQHEFILLAHKGEPPVPEQKNLSNVWFFDRLIETVHPTEKPIPLIQHALKVYNKPGDVILDPFAGSFSTCMAAKMLGMHYIGAEFLPEYFAVGEQRMAGGALSVQNAKGTIVQRLEGAPLLEFFDE